MEVIGDFAESQGIFIAYAALFVLALIPVYLGSVTGLQTKPHQPDQEFFSFDDAKMFPVMGSVTLFSLYLVFRFLDRSWVNLVVTAYFCLLGVGSLYQASLSGLRSITGKTFVGKYSLAVKNQSKKLLYIKFGFIDIFLLSLSCAFSAAYAVTKNWVLSDIYGEAFAITAIQLLKLDSFATGMVLLSGLFFYDIFWVFGTDVMVSVANSFDAPVKVVFPKNLLHQSQFTMLGLGDIVIPGIYVALCLQFDYHQAKKNGAVANFKKPYFYSAGIAYCISLITTVVVMHTFKAAQPALLYISPAEIISTLVTGFARGELKEIFAYRANPIDTKALKTNAETDIASIRGDGPASAAGRRKKIE